MSEETLNWGRPGHYGISGMQERVERLGGTISIRSRIGQGTEVDLSVPAHLLYQDGLPPSGSRLADKWRYVTGRFWIRKPRRGREPQTTVLEKGSEAHEPDRKKSRRPPERNGGLAGTDIPLYRAGEHRFFIYN